MKKLMFSEIDLQVDLTGLPEDFNDLDLLGILEESDSKMFIENFPYKVYDVDLLTQGQVDVTYENHHSSYNKETLHIV
jgi:hypothetical protein